MLLVVGDYHERHAASQLLLVGAYTRRRVLHRHASASIGVARDRRRASSSSRSSACPDSTRRDIVVERRVLRRGVLLRLDDAEPAALHASSSRQRAAALERERDEEAKRAVADERLRIAQELHDVVAHSMGVIAVQAGVGAHVIDNDPAEAKKSLEAISATSRSTLTEIRRMLGVLRDDDGRRVRNRRPASADLDRLVARRRGGRARRRRAASRATRAERAARRRPHRVPHRAGGADQRVEARGPGARATWSSATSPARCGSRSSTTGAASTAAPSDGGHGLVGMRERVGGLRRHARRRARSAGGGFRVAGDAALRETPT